MRAFGILLCVLSALQIVIGVHNRDVVYTAVGMTQMNLAILYKEWKP